MHGEREQPVRRVLMTGDTVGGVWTFVLELAKGLAADRIQVVLAGLGGLPSPDQAAEAEAIPNLVLLSSDFKLEWMEDPWRDVAASGRWLLEMEREYQPDVIHLNSFGHGALPWHAPAVLTAHSCVLSWWGAVKKEPLPAAWDRYRTETARSLHAVALVTAPSEAMAAALSVYYRLPESSCRVIANGRNASDFCRGRKEPFILAAGRMWDEAKNMQSLAAVASDAAWPLYIAGDAGAGSHGACRPLGRLSGSALAGWYSRAAVFAAPARYEPFGLSILEAALSGCALVLGDISSLRKIWGDAALFVDPDDSAALLCTLNRLMENPALREQMSERAWKRASAFDTSRMVDAYLNAYRHSVAGGKLQCVS